MTPHDPERPRPDGPNEPTDQPPAHSEAGEATGTWAFVSPFAASPASFVGPSSPSEPGRPAPDAPADTDDQPATGPAPAFGRPDWGPAGQAGWENSTTGAVGGGSWIPGGPPNPPPTWGPPPAPGQPPTWGAPSSPDPNGKPPSRWKTWQKVAAGGVLAGVVAVGGVAAVSAANASSNGDASQAGFTGGGPNVGGGESGRADGGMRAGMAGALELANALHGDFVVSSGSGTQTMRLQTGELTAVAGDSITVKSSDGYTSTYAVGAGVDVSGLTQGETVRVIGTVDGDTATATSVTSGTAGAAGGFGGFGGFGGRAGQGQSGRGTGESGMQPPEGMTPPNGADQAPQTS